MKIFVNPLRVAAAIMVAASTATAGVTAPFTEEFNADASDWRDTAGDPLSWQATGGVNNSGYVTTTANFQNNNSADFVTLFRGQDEFGSSGNAFVGDWITAGVQEFAFWVRHDADAPMTVFARFATAANFPAAAIVELDPIQPNVWTEVAFEISQDNPNIIYEGGPSNFFSVFGGIGHVQVGAGAGSFAGVDQNIAFDLDRVGIDVPTPGSLAVLATVGLVGLRRRRRS